LGAAAIVADTATSYRLAFGADALTFLLAAALLRLVPATGRRSTARDRSADGSGKTRAGRIHGVFADRGFVAVGVANMLLCLYIPLIDVAIPLWVVNRTHAPKWIIPGVFIVNSLLVVALQYRVAKDIHGVDHGVRSLRWAGGLLFAGMILYASSGMRASPWQAAVLLLTA